MSWILYNRRFIYNFGHLKRSQLTSIAIAVRCARAYTLNLKHQSFFIYIKQGKSLLQDQVYKRDNNVQRNYFGTENILYNVLQPVGHVHAGTPPVIRFKIKPEKKIMIRSILRCHFLYFLSLSSHFFLTLSPLITLSFSFTFTSSRSCLFSVSLTSLTEKGIFTN